MWERGADSALDDAGGVSGLRERAEWRQQKGQSDGGRAGMLTSAAGSENRNKLKRTRAEPLQRATRTADGLAGGGGSEDRRVVNRKRRRECWAGGRRRGMEAREPRRRRGSHAWPKPLIDTALHCTALRLRCEVDADAIATVNDYGQ